MNISGGCRVGRGVAEGVLGSRLVRPFLLALALFAATAGWGCRHKASPADVKAARKVAGEYLDAWLQEQWHRMYELSTRHRIEHLTNLDPNKGSEFAKRAYERFALVAEQAKRYMGYERFEIEKVAASKKQVVVFLVKARSEDGKESEFLLRLVRRDGAWRVD